MRLLRFLISLWLATTMTTAYGDRSSLIISSTAGGNLIADFLHPIQNLKLSAKQTGRDEFRIELEGKGWQIVSQINPKLQSATIDGDGLVFTLQEMDILKSLKSSLELMFEAKPYLTKLDALLLANIVYLSNSPIGYSHKNRLIEDSSISTNFRQGNEGITCIRKNTFVFAEYIDFRGSHRDKVKVGSKPRSNYGCMGRCGADCGNFLPDAWTKDCLDHDQCSHINEASGGNSDPNCGEEFNHAADDYLFGVIRGCNGG